MSTQPPEAWADLIEALTMLARHPSNDTSPTNCTHDELTVMADPYAFTTDELRRLDELGFHAGTPGTAHEGTFYSFRFGSA